MKRKNVTLGLIDIINAKEITVEKFEKNKLVSKTNFKGLKVIDVDLGKNAQNLTDEFSVTFNADFC